MIRPALVLTLIASAFPAASQTDKETRCGHTADIAAAIVEARLKGIAERDLPKELAKVATWPEN